MNRRIILLVAILLLSVSVSNAQNADNKWGLGAHFGVMEYNGDYDNEFYTFKQGWGLGASVSRYINPSFDVMAHFFYDQTHSLKGDPTWFGFDADMYNLNLLAKYKFNNGYLLKEDARLAPFILGGLGGNNSISTGKNDSGEFKDLNVLVPNVYGGLGVNVRITAAINIAIQSSLMIPFTDKIDGWYPDIPANKSPDFFLQNSVGLYITPGKAKKKDADGDGVNDKLDKCPDTPAGVPVDVNGCPLDTDKDGILDYLDECPTVAGLKEFNGCPDTDKDGVQDKLDECPDVFGLSALKGCPDADGDGITDKGDRCPNTPKGYKVDKFGCPIDADKDGIPDSEDACPEKAGVSELKGCPFTIQTVIAKYTLSMAPLYFDFDSYSLKPEGISELDKIANALTNHVDFGVQFDGHADYVGSEAYNLKLSEKRANSTKSYLNNKGITDNRIRLQFFGEAKPVQDNKTKIGRETNRRVEYSLFELEK